MVLVAESQPRDTSDPADLVVPIGDKPRVLAPQPVPTTLQPPLPTDRERGWMVTLVITIVGAVVRLWQIGARTDGGTPLFDEKYYAVQAAEMLRTGGVDDNQAYGVIVHPPLGKQLIALSEMIFGYNPQGWRIASAVAGIAAIFIVIRVVRRLTRSTLLGGIAGVLLIADSMSQVMSQLALLDSLQVPFVVGALACLVVDRDQVRTRLASAVGHAESAAREGWHRLGARWWRLGAGLLLGMATGIKLNGAYWVAAFGVLALIWDMTARRQYGARRPVVAVVRRDLLGSIWALGILPVLTYLASYWAWFASETGWDRHVSGSDGLIGSLKSFVTMTAAMISTGAGIMTPEDPAERHPWESKPWAWPMSLRPVLIYVARDDDVAWCGSGSTDCVKRIMLVGTPLLWWVSIGVLIWALWKAIGRLDYRYAAVLTVYGAGYLPWFFFFDRQMYFFYMAPLAPILVIGITLVLGDILGRASPPAAVAADSADELVPATWWHDRRLWRLLAVSVYVGAVVANFLFLWPILMGDPITQQELTWRIWLPSW